MTRLEGRTLALTAPRQLRLDPITIDSAQLRPLDLLIEVEYSVISPGTELAFYSGIQAEMFERERHPLHYPTGLGYCSVGRVVGRGSDVPAAQYPDGTWVVAQPRHASLAVVGLTSVVVPIPEQTPRHLAGFARLAAISATALRVAAARPGDWVAVYGLGIIGNFAAQLFSIAGCLVIGLDLSARRRAIAAECGITARIDPSTQDPLVAAAELTGGVGVRTVVEATGLSPLALPALRLARRLGEVILLGSPRQPCQGDVTELLRQVHIRGVTLKGALGGLYPSHETEAAAGAQGPEASQVSVEANVRWLLDLIGTGRLQVAPLLLHTVRPEAVAAAYEGHLAHPDAYLGTVIDWTSARGAP